MVHQTGCLYTHMNPWILDCKILALFFSLVAFVSCASSYDICHTDAQLYRYIRGGGPGGPLAVFGTLAVMQIYSGHRSIYKSTVEIFHTKLWRNAIQIYCVLSRRLTEDDTLSTSCFYSSASSYLSFSIPINTCSQANLLYFSLFFATQHSLLLHSLLLDRVFTKIQGDFFTGNSLKVPSTKKIYARLGVSWLGRSTKTKIRLASVFHTKIFRCATISCFQAVRK